MGAPEEPWESWLVNASVNSGCAEAIKFHKLSLRLSRAKYRRRALLGLSIISIHFIVVVI